MQHEIDLDVTWKEYCIGDMYVGLLGPYSLDFDDVCDFMQKIDNPQADESLQSYGSFSQSSLVYRDSTIESRVVCTVVGLDARTGEVHIKTSENPSKPLVRLYADLIGPYGLYRYCGYLKPFQSITYCGIKFGNVVPQHMVGNPIFNPPIPGVFGLKPSIVAVQLSPDSSSYVLTALVDVDVADSETPLVIRHSADYSVPCIKMAKDCKVRWMLNNRV
jgi:hypothetical protein